MLLNRGNNASITAHALRNWRKDEQRARIIERLRFIVEVMVAHEDDVMSDAIRVGLIGYGYASKTFHAPLISGTPGMALSAVVSSDAQKVLADWPATQVVTSANSLNADPDIDLIVIPTPNDTHFPLARAALEAGKHVIVDKPFTVTLSQARELDAIARSHGRLLSVFHNRRWDSDFLTLKALIAAGDLGRSVILNHISIAFARRFVTAGVSRAVLAAVSGMTWAPICWIRRSICLACR